MFNFNYFCFAINNSINLIIGDTKIELIRKVRNIITVRIDDGELQRYRLITPVKKTVKFSVSQRKKEQVKRSTISQQEKTKAKPSTVPKCEKTEVKPLRISQRRKTQVIPFMISHDSRRKKAEVKPSTTPQRKNTKGQPKQKELERLKCDEMMSQNSRFKVVLNRLTREDIRLLQKKVEREEKVKKIQSAIKNLPRKY